MCVRMSIAIQKLPSFSTDDFHRYWSGSHASTFLSFPIVQKNLIKYQQFHIDNRVRDELAKSGLPVSDVDGMAEFWAKNMEDLMAVFQDPEYLRIVVPDEQKLLEREATLPSYRQISSECHG